MFEISFFFLLLVVMVVLFRWGFVALPREGWQIMAVVPVAQVDSRTWKGLNLTFYGLLMAVSVIASVAVFLVLMGSIGVSLSTSLAMIVFLFSLCIPASSLLARVVEKRQNTFTIGGSAFLGLLVAPAVVWIVNSVVVGESPGAIPMIPGLACMAIAYALGEGIGRLACISFGCCYGKRISECHPIIQRLFGKYSFVFQGKTKKIQYEGGMEGVPVIPIQALTCTVLVFTALVGSGLYVKGAYVHAFLFCTIAAQAWRAISEFLRADYRGNGKISAYQVMAVLAIVYGITLSKLLPADDYPVPVLLNGLKLLWDPASILALELLGLVVFLHSGRSKVTGALLSFHLTCDPIPMISESRKENV
ncbi:prolipoprotein diacylglyceryl transferase family protein [Desulfomonile tiedjei]|uniref:Prolipoprotein diacylglyceryl transferase n=1 Tax=Desulfomonile tiedjei (strain ATCC 49306 / DSM 6799 / DCB-1) TaxID=706587 RepID=I4CEZ4_DESTA|nr:prolipoprotein diacylglyceryl transferase family protein [Desulfomonile tiedjei]AFM28135.1 Prolipoprotein diacylglyceryl transferase [Desulfomonile tiedjei DSM 6799]